MKLKPILFCALLLILALQVQAAAPRYFVIADHPIGAQGRLLEFGNPDYSSCLVPITDTNDIAYARLLYQRHNLGRYPDAEIDLGPTPQTRCYVSIQPFTTYNCNYMSPSSGLWSWSVSRFLQFQPFVGYFDTVPLNHIGVLYDELGLQRITADFEQIALEFDAEVYMGYEFVGELPIQPTVFMSNGWKKSDWLGVYYDAPYPWVYSEELGWLYLIPGKFDPFDIWMYVATDGLGWVWTSETVYPQAWHPGQGDWVNLPDLID